MRMKDVAHVMGVSTTTVSNAFNRPDQLSPELRARILARAAKMGYPGPNVAGRALRKGRFNAYGVMFMDSLAVTFADAFKVNWLGGFSEILAQRQASLVLLPAADARSCVEMVQNSMIDGLAVTWVTHPVLDLARARGLEVVAGGMQGPCYVTIDEYAAGATMGDHVRSLGHTSVGLVLGPLAAPAAQPRAARWTDYRRELRGPLWERVEGLADALEDANVTVIQTTAWNRRAGQEAAKHALATRPELTALVCLADPLAAGAMDAVIAAGICPGTDMTMTGFDRTPQAAELGITTIDAHAHQQGHETARLLINPDRQPRQVVIDHHLIARRSSGVVRSTEACPSEGSGSRP